MVQWQWYLKVKRRRRLSLSGEDCGRHSGGGECG
ncbi:hypothetical protein CCACVL1_27014 [Corchorus capsularis]|uniref:Uncharacterized protein n=1 Tax=Corchorus capsularis TaxID=210143 RepID=A0A1R3GCI9_COCAP|nr:hypothetical protein CCACVL1_27014 [Corchorus capsularis]